MMNDYLVVIPFGIAVAVGGLLSLPLRVISQINAADDKHMATKLSC